MASGVSTAASAAWSRVSHLEVLLTHGSYAQTDKLILTWVRQLRASKWGISSARAALEGASAPVAGIPSGSSAVLDGGAMCQPAGGGGGPVDAVALIAPCVGIMQRSVEVVVEVVVTCIETLTAFVGLLQAGGVAFANVNVAMNVLADAALQCVCRPHEVEVEEAIDSVIYDLLEACVCGPLGHLLSSGIITSITNSCVSIFLEPHATMLLRNRSRRALTRFVSALFSDVPAVLSRTVVPVDGALRALTPPTPGDGGADPRKAAQTFSEAVAGHRAPDPYDLYTLVAILRKCVGLLGRSESSVTLGLQLLTAAVTRGGSALALPGAAPLLHILQHDVALHVVWLGTGSDSSPLDLLGSLGLTHTLFDVCGDSLAPQLELLLHHILLRRIAAPGPATAETSLCLSGVASLVSCLCFAPYAFTSFDARPPCSNVLATLLGALAGQAAAAVYLPGGLPDPEVGGVGGGKGDAPADAAGGGGSRSVVPVVRPLAKLAGHRRAPGGAGGGGKRAGVDGVAAAVDAAWSAVRSIRLLADQLDTYEQGSPAASVMLDLDACDTEGCASPTVLSSSDDPSVPRSLRELLQLKGAYATASTVFNTSAKKGLAALGQALGRDLTPRDVACFLRFGTGLSKELIGSCIGEGTSPFQAQLRGEFCALFDFQDRPFLECIRVFFQAFRLPGESQQIDRILDAFSNVLHKCCSERELLATPDVAHLLSMSVVMLNTSLHNPNIRADRRTTLDAFLHTNRNYGKEVSRGQSLPDSLLTSLYNDIAECSIRPPCPTDVATDWSVTVSRSVWQETTRGNSVLSHTNLLAADTPLVDVYAAMAPMLFESAVLAELAVIQATSSLAMARVSAQRLLALGALAVRHDAPSGVDSIVRALCRLALCVPRSQSLPEHVVQGCVDPALRLAQDNLGALLPSTWRLHIDLLLRTRSGDELVLEASVPHDDLVHFRHDLHRELRTAIASDGTVSAKDLLPAAGRGRSLSVDLDVAASLSAAPSPGHPSGVGREPTRSVSANVSPVPLDLQGDGSPAKLTLQELVAESRYLDPEALDVMCNALASVMRDHEAAPSAGAASAASGSTAETDTDQTPTPLVPSRSVAPDWTTVCANINTSALVRAQPDTSPLSDADRAALAQACGDVLLRNKDRATSVLPVLTSALAIAVRAAGTGAVAQVLRAAGRLLECALQLLPRLDDGESCLAVLLEPLQATDGLLDCPGLEFVVAQGMLRLLKSPALRTHPLSAATWHVLANVCTLCAKPTSAGAALLDGLEGLLVPGPGDSVPVPLRVVQLLSTLLRGHPVQQSDVCSRALGLLAAVHRVLLASPPPIPPPSQRGEDEEDIDQSEAPSESAAPASVPASGISHVPSRGHIGPPPIGRSGTAKPEPLSRLTPVLALQLPAPPATSEGEPRGDGQEVPLSPRSPVSPVRPAFVPRGLDVPIGARVGDRSSWFRRWLYVLSGLSDGCLSPSVSVRGAALKELKLCLAEVALPVLAPEEWVSVVDDIVLANLTTLLTMCSMSSDAHAITSVSAPSLTPLSGIDTAVSMCCQTLLHTLPALQQAQPPTLFADLWIRAVTLIAAVHGALPSGDATRRETIVGILRNMVLVVSSLGALNGPASASPTAFASSSSPQPLWQRTLVALASVPLHAGSDAAGDSWDAMLAMPVAPVGTVSSPLD